MSNVQRKKQKTDSWLFEIFMKDWEAVLFDEHKTSISVPAETGWTPYKLDKNLEVGIPCSIRVCRNGGTVTTYTHQKHIGHGSNGTVELLVATCDPTKKIALKITAESETRVLEQIRRSGLVCGHIRAREIVGFGGPGYPYVMPCMDGDLLALLRSADGCGDRAELAEQVRWQVVQLLRATGVPYMDLKLENVLYRRTVGSESLTVRVADLGSLDPVECDGTTVVVATFPPPEYSGGLVEVDRLGANDGHRERHERLLSWSVGVFMLLLFDYALAYRYLTFSSDNYKPYRVKEAVLQGQAVLREHCFPEEVVRLLSFDAAQRPLVGHVRISKRS